FLSRNGHLFPAHRLHLIGELKHFLVHLDKPYSSAAKLLITAYLALYLNEKATWDCAQLSFALLACAQNHAVMELALSAFAPWFSTFSLQFIDGSFDYRRIGKKWFNNLPDLPG
ncbi:MAG: hypothetical protein JRI71_10550, partial [Deltaproteobacteria bacterium]|nr:hypothetical protein [Deltaproteobacteria bacterium]